MYFATNTHRKTVKIQRFYSFPEYFMVLVLFCVFSKLYDLIPLCHFLFLGRKKRVLVNTKSCISSTKLCRTSRLCPFSLFLLSLFFSETWVINTNLPLILFSLKNWKQRVMSRSQAFPLFAGCI